MGVDDVGRLRRSAKVTRRPGDSAIQSNFRGAIQQARQQGLARAAASPSLRYTAGRRHDSVTAASSCLYQGRHLPVAAIKSDQPTRVKYKAHLRCAGTLLGFLLQDAIRLCNLGLG